MPKSWREYIAGAERQVSRIERIIDRLDKGYQSVRRRSERAVKNGLMDWLKGSPKQEASAYNAFRRIQRNAPVFLAWSAVDNGMQLIADLDKKLPVRAGVGLAPEDAINASLATGMMVHESEEFVEELDLEDADDDYLDETAELIVADYAFNISGIITRDGRRIKEEMTRSVQAGEPVATIAGRIGNFAINNSYFRLSTLQHPRAVVRSVIFGATVATIAAGRLGYEKEKNSKWTVLPKEPEHSRQVDDELTYRIFTAQELDARMKKRANQDKPGGDWRGLGLSYNTDEYYIPLFATHEDDADKWSKEKRKELREAR